MAKYTEDEIKNACDCLAALMRGERVEYKTISPPEWMRIAGLVQFAELVRQERELRIAPKPHPLEGLPINTKVIVQGTGAQKYGGFFHGFTPIGDVQLGAAIRPDGLIHSSCAYTRKPDQIVGLAESDWIVHRGDECPLPGWVKVMRRSLGADGYFSPATTSKPAKDHDWVYPCIYQIQKQDVPNE